MSTFDALDTFPHCTNCRFQLKADSMERVDSQYKYAKCGQTWEIRIVEMQAYFLATSRLPDPSEYFDYCTMARKPTGNCKLEGIHFESLESGPNIRVLLKLSDLASTEPTAPRRVWGQRFKTWILNRVSKAK